MKNFTKEELIEIIRVKHEIIQNLLQQKKQLKNDLSKMATELDTLVKTLNDIVIRKAD